MGRPAIVPGRLDRGPARGGRHGPGGSAMGAIGRLPTAWRPLHPVGYDMDGSDS